MLFQAPKSQTINLHCLMTNQKLLFKPKLIIQIRIVYSFNLSRTVYNNWKGVKGVDVSPYISLWRSEALSTTITMQRKETWPVLCMYEHVNAIHQDASCEINKSRILNSPDVWDHPRLWFLAHLLLLLLLFSTCRISTVFIANFHAVCGVAIAAKV